MSNDLTPVESVKTTIYAMVPSFKQTLPAHVDADKFAKIALTAITNDPDLMSADKRTLYTAVARAAEMGLLPDKREGAIVLFKGKCQFMPMIAGIMKNVRNSGEISSWSIQVVYENDEFEFQLGDDEKIIHKPVLSNRGKIIAAYSIVTLKDGEKSREVMGIEDLEKVRANAPSGNSPAWKTWESEMHRKTVARRHAKRLPSSTDINGLFQEDASLFDNTDHNQTEQQKQPKQRPSSLQGVIDSTANEVTETNHPNIDDDLLI